MKMVPILIACLALAGCGVAHAAGIRLTSAAVGVDGRIAARQSAHGQNLSPPLSWSGGAGAKTYAIVLEDSDAPGARPFVHWLVWNIPGAMTSLAEGRVPAGAAQGANDAGGTGYFGPRPPSGIHHYHFKIFALDGTLGLAAGADRAALSRAMNGHVLAGGELVGTFAAPGAR